MTNRPEKLLQKGREKKRKTGKYEHNLLHTIMAFIFPLHLIFYSVSKAEKRQQQQKRYKLP
jgi:hypothetical protein